MSEPSERLPGGFWAEEAPSSSCCGRGGLGLSSGAAPLGRIPGKRGRGRLWAEDPGSASESGWVHCSLSLLPGECGAPHKEQSPGPTPLPESRGLGSPLPPSLRSLHRQARPSLLHSTHAGWARLWLRRATIWEPRAQSLWCWPEGTQDPGAASTRVPDFLLLPTWDRARGLLWGCEPSAPPTDPRPGLAPVTGTAQGDRGQPADMCPPGLPLSLQPPPSNHCLKIPKINSQL